MQKSLIALAAAASLAGCSWVEVTPAGAAVRVAQSLDEVAACKKIGATTSSVLAKVGLERGREKVAMELETLARNQAAELGANTVVPISPVTEGKRKFGLYQCP